MNFLKVARPMGCPVAKESSEAHNSYSVLAETHLLTLRLRDILHVREGLGPWKFLITPEKLVITKNVSKIPLKKRSLEVCMR